MSDTGRFGGRELVLMIVVLAAAAGARGWYLFDLADGGRADGPFQVQDASPTPAYPADTTLHGRASPRELDALLHNLKEHQWFGALAPLAAQEERTAHVAPGYPWLL